MTDWSSLLNSEQCAAVTAPDGPLLVLAAAGTGKTRTLTYRVAFLMEQGVAPSEILLLTFTNRAAREMLERAEQLVGPAITHLWSGTFHHVCNRILRSYASRLGYSSGFVILDRDDANSLLGKCLKAVVSDTKHFPKKEVIASMIGKAANTQTDLLDIVRAATFKDPVNEEQILEIAHRYEQSKRETNAMDFDDLLTETLRLFRECPDVLERYARSFRYVLVDEYQDTNIIQSQLVDMLASHHRNIMAVGDDFQCIYSWRGADFRNIMEFPQRWQGCRIVKLERNYRSVPEVLSVANACISGNPEQFEKELRPVRGPSHRPMIAYLRDAQEQAQMVMRHVQRALQAGYKPTDIAVLYRSHFHVMELELAMRRQRMEYTLTSGQGVFESMHAKDVIAWLRMCNGGTDLFAFTRVMGLLQGVGPKTAEKLWQKLGATFDSSQEIQRLQLKSVMPKKAKEDWEVLDGLLAEYHREGLDNNGNRAVTRFLDAWYEAYLLRTYDNGEDRRDDVAAIAGQQLQRGVPVGQFLYDAALMTNLDAENMPSARQSSGVRLSTVHQAKGLEWPVVIVLWCNEEMFPSGRAIREGTEAEERRLFYVAVTRAKDELLLCVPSSRFMPGNSGTLYLRPSRFIKELPADLTERRYGLY